MVAHQLCPLVEVVNQPDGVPAVVPFRGERHQDRQRKVGLLTGKKKWPIGWFRKLYILPRKIVKKFVKFLGDLGIRIDTNTAFCWIRQRSFYFDAHWKIVQLKRFRTSSSRTPLWSRRRQVVGRLRCKVLRLVPMPEIRSCIRARSSQDCWKILIALDMGPVWPEKNRQMSVKVAQKWFH